MFDQDRFLPDPSEQHLRCYRLLWLDASERIHRAEMVPSVDDADAVQAVRGLMGNSSVELWDRGRFIGRFDPACEPDYGF
jgi:hypothetical protein